MDKVKTKVKDNKKGIIIAVVIITLFILLMVWSNRRAKKLKKIFVRPKDGREEYKVKQSDLIKSQKNSGLAWTLSFWIYIDDWTYRYGRNKYIIQWPNCTVWLAKKSNDLFVHIPTFNDRRGERILYRKVPVQKWLHICIILENRSLDLWVNSKLYHSKHLKNIPEQKPKAPMIICPDGGYSGFISRLRYYNVKIPRTSIIDPDSIYKIYKFTPFPWIHRIPLFGAFFKALGSVKFDIKVDVSASADYN